MYARVERVSCYLSCAFLESKFNALYGRLTVHFVGSDRKRAFLEELELFERRYLTPLHHKFQTWISCLNLKSLSPLGALKCWLMISTFPILAPNIIAPGLWDSWRFLPGISSCSPPGGGGGGVYLTSTRLLGTTWVSDFIPGSLEDTKKYIEVVDGHHNTANQKGKVQIKICDNNGDNFIATFHNVFLAPDLCNSLFSIINLTNSGHNCLFHKSFCTVYFDDKEKMRLLYHIVHRQNMHLGENKANVQDKENST